MAQPPRPSTPRRHLLAAPALAAGLAVWARAAGKGALAAAPAGATAAQFRQLRERMRADALAESGPGAAAEMLARQAADGSWKDVDYADQAVGNWRPMAHLERLRRMARALAEPVPPQGEMATALERGLDFWLGRKPRSENWWHNTIGQQRELVRILLLSPDALPPALMKRLLAELVDPSMVPAEQATGQNRVWYASQQIVRGAVAQQADDVAAGSRGVASTLRITLDEGIQPDHSFHQHGPQLYSGGYGLALLVDVVQVAAWLHELPWALPTDALNVLSDYALQGMAPLARGNWFDWSARGREFTRVEHRPLPAQLAAALTRLAPLVPQHRAAVDRTAQALQRGAPAATGTRAFWRSDFLVHHTPQAYFSLKLSSARTVGTESGNGENLQGFWLPFGVTYLLKRGDEYDGMPPVWDWSALPGLTAPDVVPQFKGYQRHDARFVGVLAVGDAAVAVMDVDKAGLRAQLAWFFMGDLMVAMGTNIRCNLPQPVWTTLNQCRLRGPVHTDQGALASPAVPLPERTRWLWHAGLTYLFDEGAAPQLARTQRTGERSAINTMAVAGVSSAEVMLLRLAHGSRPQGSAYRYGVWAGADNPAQAARAPRVEQISDDLGLQAIRDPGGNRHMAVLRGAGRLDLGRGDWLDVSGACLLHCRAEGRSLAVTVADPTRSSAPLALTLRRANGKTSSASANIARDPAKPYSATLTLMA
ncbi:polysaccharide lyase family 8 super-sandwich domain-containing protein [Aquabacterium sp. OR-4]|uniref:polysaccharide lyase family 8 super-sandwich domain-containing protein n=1 Tax=Aquabacterium sp. OR-4 TaxID=2978127 RepID=UPI0028C6F446|nr:polysaccharide lyase family 8 super-sandwich domain-containing protein [Aquabacterium sp. OR-4]MDT7835867.1 polysaccharide lyase family 8 super-sandwich domain-containing protein [Aquabacterium sp. OR-4]